MTRPGSALRRVLLEWGEQRGADLAQTFEKLDNAQLKELVFNMGDHVVRQILCTLSRAARMQGPLVIIAYTTKGWRLPIAGHLENHAAVLTDARQLSPSWTVTR
jgi:pyruvate dehydrogenase E1 component